MIIIIYDYVLAWLIGTNFLLIDTLFSNNTLLSLPIWGGFDIKYSTFYICFQIIKCPAFNGNDDTVGTYTKIFKNKKYTFASVI